MGHEYLVEQIESLFAQTHQNWMLWASDDQSKDGTRAILEEYFARFGSSKLNIKDGLGKGYVANFLSMTCNADINADYYAYSDQDDIWLPDKLERSVRWLCTIPMEVPAIYCSRTLIVDRGNRVIGLSPLFRKPPSFINALMQNIGGGNTMVFNNAARSLLMKAGQDLDIIAHDWWAYLVVTACGGRVYYDPTPTVRYRQHGKNLVGSNNSIHARLKRIKMLWVGHFKILNDKHIRALNSISTNITQDNISTLASFQSARTSSLIPRMLGFARLKPYRQTILGNLGLIVAIIFKKI